MSEEISVVTILNELVRTHIHDLDEAVASAIGKLASQSGAGWGCVFRHDSDGHLVKTHDWTANGLPDVPCTVETMLLPFVPTVTEGDAVHVPDLSALPDTAALTTLGVRSILVLPMVQDGALAGIVGFAQGPDGPGFSPERISLLKSAAEVIATVLARRATELTYHDTARRLEATLRALPDLLFEIEADGHFAEFTAGPPDLMAAPPHLLRGQHFATLLPPDVARVVQRALDQALEYGRVDGVRYRLDLPVGPRWFELTGALKPAERAEAPPNVIFLVRDVTQDESLRTELLRLGKIVETMSNLVAIIDNDQNIVWVNAAFEAQTGWTLAEIKGRYLGDVVRCDDTDPDTTAAVADAIARRQAFSGQAINQDRHGTRYWVEFNVVPLFDASGAPQGFVSVETVVTKSKEQEEAVARLARTATEAHTRLENAVRALPDGVVILDDQDRIVVANSAYREMFPALAPYIVDGVTLGDLLRTAAKLGIFGPGGTDADMDRWVEQRVATYRTPRHIDEVRLPDGRWLRRIHTRTSDGGCIAVALDVTARRNHITALDSANRDLTHALAERDRAERRLLGIIEGAEVGTWEWDIANFTLRVGGRWAEMLGRDPDEGVEFNTDAFRELVHPDDLDALPTAETIVHARGEDFQELEFRMRHDDGHWVWILSRSRITARSAEGVPLIMAGVHLDISDRKWLEQEIRASRAYLSEVMDTSIAALAVLDDQGRIVYVNLEAERILGLTRRDSRGKSYNDASWRLERVDGSPLPDDELPFRQALAKGSVRDIRFALHWPDGSRRVLSANAVPLSPTDGLVQVVVSFSDITDELAATSRLEEARARAEEMSRAKSIFLANMSHEIRTPLNGVLGMAEVLESIITVPEQKQMIDTIRRSGETLLTVLNSILDMSKIEAGKMAIEQVAMIPADILAQVEALHAVQAEEKGLEFEVLASAGSDRARIGDPHRITQILNNLLNNAIKFTERGSVTLKLSCRTGKPLVIEVSDTGVGMTPAQLARVFESFEQADGSMTRRFGGTGLGLSIVRELVLLMGGTIDLSSEPGTGTRVRVSLPLPEADTQPAPQAEKEAAPNLDFLLDRHLLVADDNVTNRLVLSEMLAQTGVKVTLVENGQDAISAWDRAHRSGTAFDLLLLDITMPVLDGLSALSEIRRREATVGGGAVPAIAVTANAMPNQVADYIMGGFDTHLAKPFKRKDLIHAIRSLIAG